MKPWQRSALVWIRTLHVYASLLAFLLLLFFTVTGWLMVHQEALGLDKTRTRLSTHPLPAAITDEALKAYLHDSLGVKGTLVEEESDLLHYRRPGGATLVEIDRGNNELRLTEESQGLSGRLFDMHRDRGGGALATWIQNLTAFLFVMVSLSGLLLWLPLPKRRSAGLLALLAGLILLLVWWGAA
jgi:hypothetical protein